LFVFSLEKEKKSIWNVVLPEQSLLHGVKYRKRRWWVHCYDRLQLRTLRSQTARHQDEQRVPAVLLDKLPDSMATHHCQDQHC